MKKTLYTCLILMIMAGCGGARATMPQIDLPTEPSRPKIHWRVIQYQNEPYIGLKIGDGLALTEYLIRLDAYGQQCRNRINSMNQLLQGK